MFANKHQPSFKLIFSLAALLALVEALATYAQSSYLSQFFSLSQIGLVAAVSAIVTLIWSSFHPELIARHGNYQSALATTSLILASHLALALTSNHALIIGAIILRYAGLALMYVHFDLALESISDARSIGSSRTKYLTVMNLAWLVSPSLMSYLIGDNNYRALYSFSALIVSILLIALITNRRYLDQVFHFSNRENNWLHSFKLMLKNNNLRPVFFSALSLQMFYSIAVLYIPIHLNQNLNIPWSELGWVFTIMLLAFIIIEWPAGILADRKLGEKEMMIAGNIIIATSCISIYLNSSSSILIWTWLLLFSRVGAALCESMEEVYFFKQVTDRDLGLINLFRQTRTIGWLIGSSFAAIILFFTNIPSLFLVMGLIFFANGLLLKKIIDTK
jgi:MFS family permease